jgi:hypothetical protein
MYRRVLNISLKLGTNKRKYLSELEGTIMEFKEAICIAGHTWIQNCCANVRRYSTFTPSYYSRVGGKRGGEG